MIKVYFDWNVYSNIRQNRGNVFSNIRTFLEKYDEYILLTYSPAHLQDLKRSYFKSEKGRTETKLDLEFLGSLTKNHCLCYDIKSKTVYPDIIDPSEYFKNIFIDNRIENLFDFDQIFEDDDPLGKLWKSSWNLIRSLPTGVNVNDFTDLPDKYKIIGDLFKSTQNSNTLGALLDDIFELLRQPDEFEKAFKTVREISGRDLKLESDPSKWGNPFEYLDNVFAINQFQKSFFELTNGIIKESNKKASRFDYFTNYYIQLDVLGFYKDKKLANLVDDASHSFYGAHTDIFVTEDNNTNQKSKALYKQLNISTVVVTSDEFLSLIRRNILFEEEKNIFKQIKHLISSSLLLLNSVDEELNPAQVFKVEPRLLGYFNRMQITDFTDSNHVLFYKKQSNYSEFMFWTEISVVINKISQELGMDLNNRQEFSDLDKRELSNEKWNGRFWKINDVNIVLDYLEHPFALTFRIEIRKSGNIS